MSNDRPKSRFREQYERAKARNESLPPHARMTFTVPMPWAAGLRNSKAQTPES